MVMCAPRSVYPWDLVLTKLDQKIFIDRREGSALDMITVNENAADAPLDASEGNKDTINNPSALMMEATHINQVFPLQVVKESETAKKEMEHDHPFYNASEEDGPSGVQGAYRIQDGSTCRSQRTRSRCI